MAMLIAIQVLLYYSKPLLSAEDGIDRKCDIFHELNATTEQCVCSGIMPYPYSCPQQELEVGYCMTLNESTGVLAAGLCPYPQRLDENITLDLDNLKVRLSPMHSGKELNDAMCDHLNRTGFLCGKCKESNGVAVYSKSFECVYCNERNEAWMWVLYLALETVPVTLVYFAIIVFNIRATSPPYTSFLFHNQFISFINTFSVYKVLTSYGASQPLYKVTMAVLDIWNLDVLRHIIPFFCVRSSLSNFDVQLMRMLSSLFPFILVLILYLLIELHDRNCRIFVLLWKPFNKCFSQFRRSWDPRSSNIAAFSTMITLSSLKVWSSAIFLIYTNQIQYSDKENSSLSLYIDPHVKLEEITSIPLFWPVSITLSMALLFPILILCLFPTRLCRRLIFCCKPGIFQFVRTFTETFQGHYKDGTNGTHDYRAVASLVFILRILAFMGFYSRSSRGGRPEAVFSIAMVHILIVTSLFYAIAQPCKKRYMNNIESMLYGLTAISYLAIINANLKPRAGGIDLRLAMSTITLVLVLLPSVVLFLKIISVNVFFRLFKSKANKKNKMPDPIADRIVHPTQYNSLP